MTPTFCSKFDMPCDTYGRHGIMVHEDLRLSYAEFSCYRHSIVCTSEFYFSVDEPIWSQGWGRGAPIRIIYKRGLRGFGYDGALDHVHNVVQAYLNLYYDAMTLEEYIMKMFG